MSNSSAAQVGEVNDETTDFAEDGHNRFSNSGHLLLNTCSGSTHGCSMGVAAFIGYLDYVLMPALVVFLGITAYAFFGKKKCKGEDDECKL